MKEEERLPGQAITQGIVDLLKKAAPECLPPAEVAGKAKAVGVTKANLDTLSTILLGILAGVFIGLGGMFFTVITTNTGLGFGMNRLIGGVVFCLGLVLVVLAGAELFTGNNLLVMAWYSGKIGFSHVLRNWFLVYFANFIGSLSLVVLMFYTLQWGLDKNGVGANAIQIANSKVNLPFTVALTRGILCNALVCLAIWLCFSARTLLDKILAIVFPIAAFVAAGFEHSVANMYFIPMGILVAGQPAAVQAAGLTPAALANLNLSGLVNNLVPVTIGNIIGGSVLVGTVYWLTYLRRDQASPGAALKRWLTTMSLLPRRRKAPALPAISVVPLREALAKSLLERNARSSPGAQGMTALDYAGSNALKEFLAKAVLARAYGDEAFFRKLAEQPHEVLKGYELTEEERLALADSNGEWLRAKVDSLSDPLGTWATLRLSQKANKN